MKAIAKLNSKDRKAAYKAIHPYTVGYRNEVPVTDMIEALQQVGLVALQEDGTPWGGVLCGAEGRAALRLAFDGAEDDRGIYPMIENAMFVLTWYKLQSGRFETVAYIS